MEEHCMTIAKLHCRTTFDIMHTGKETIERYHISTYMKAGGLLYCRSLNRATGQAGTKQCAAHQRFSGSSKKGFARATDTICQVYSLSLSAIPSMKSAKMSRNPACICLQRRQPSDIPIVWPHNTTACEAR